MYKVWDNPEKPKVLYQYTGKSTNLSYIKRVLRKQETHYIKYYNSFLDGWNQQIYNERPSQTLKKYILDYKLTKNKKLLTQIEWKLDNCNIYGKEHTKLRALLWGPRVFW